MAQVLIIDDNAPKFGAKSDTDFILGMAKKEGGVKILLDIDKVLGGAARQFVS